MAESNGIQVHIAGATVRFTAKAIKLTEETDGSFTIEAVDPPESEQPADGVAWVTGNCDTKYNSGLIYCEPNPNNPCSGSCSLKSNTSGNPKIYWCECS